MATVFVIHDSADSEFITNTLLKPLPSLGFDRWISSAALPAGDEPRALEAIAASHTLIVVVSEAAQHSDAVRRLATSVLQVAQPTVSVQIDETQPDSVADGLGALPRIDPGDAAVRAVVPMTKRIRDGLQQLLPPPEASSQPVDSGLGVRIEWNEEYFSDYLQEAMTRTDFNRGQALISSLAAHVGERPYAYPEKHARADLKTLRRKRQFVLMERYAATVIASGTEHLEVRRQYAQALIELGRLDQALPVLHRNAETTRPGEEEWLEAHGLLGRVHKQEYINAPKGEGAPDRLRHSIREYRAVCDEYPDEFWHSVNAASLLLRASRDEFDWASPDDARRIASRVVERFDVKRAANKAQVWDFASRVEALIALGRLEEAGRALDDYLTHPEMNAFEVVSTFRQFDEVLQLAAVSEATSIYDKLRRAVDRYGAGGVTSSPPQRESVERPDLLPILIRVSDPNWTPVADAQGCRISARLGTVITARVPPATIPALLKDPVVVSIEESRSVIDVQTNECEFGLPFIRYADQYHDRTGDFNEKGKHALIAFIDDGIDVLHEAFTDVTDKKTRIVGIWDQRTQEEPHPTGFDYGRYYAREEIDECLRTSTPPKSLGRNDGNPTNHGHGTHVASIAAGRSVGTFFGGIAPEAQILVVVTKADGDIGYSKAHLDALAFIDAEATRLALPVVVNVSKGMNAGAHDGKSALEVGFDEFSKGGRKPGRVVIKSAGNERAQRGHAAFSVPPGTAQRVRWTRKRQSWKFERVDVWWSAGDKLQFRVVSPGGEASKWVSDDDPDVSDNVKGGGQIHMQLTKRHIDNGDSQLRLEMGDPDKGLAQGPWTLEIIADAGNQGTPAHAWLARGGGEPSHFDNFATENMTVTVPGTAHTVITVGAVQAVKDGEPVFPGEFSSFGPTRDGREKPDVSAPGVGVKAAKAGTSNDSIVHDGTSMAAPYVAGAVALVLSRAEELKRPWPVANQIASALRQKTRNYNGHHDPGQGFGIVDVAALLAAPF